MSGEVAVIIPSYGHFDYVRNAVASLLSSTPEAQCLLIDDGSPAWNARLENDFRVASPRVHVHRFPKNGGLTRSWNLGAEMAKEMGLKYVVFGNSDVWFPRGWWDPIATALDRGWAVVGPLTNAPGHQFHQQVRKYITSNNRKFDKAAIQKLQDLMLANLKGVRKMGYVNGFMFAMKTEDVDKYRFDEEHLFDPRNKLVGNESELQVRVAKRGGAIGASLRSFVFHFRSVSRPLTRYKETAVRM